MTSVAPAAPRKRKVSVSLDADLLDALGDGEALSTQLNEVLREEVARRRRNAALGRMVDEYLEERGQPWTEEEEAEIERVMGLLGGPP